MVFIARGGTKSVGIQTDMCDPVQILTSKIKNLRKKCRSDLAKSQDTVEKLKTQGRELQFYVSIFQYEAKIRNQLASAEPTTFGILEEIVKLKKDIKRQKDRQCKLLKELNFLEAERVGSKHLTCASN